MNAKHPPGLPVTSGNMWAGFIRLTAASCFTAIMSSCASLNEDLYSPYASPGKYDFLDCPSIAERVTKASDKERELAQLMTRASEGAGGAIVNAIAYQDQYNTARAELRALRKAAEAKKCPSTDPERR